eukprot:6438500-Amphidinium_carterae.1
MASTSAVTERLYQRSHPCLSGESLTPSRFSCAWHTNSTLQTALLRHISVYAMDTLACSSSCMPATQGGTNLRPKEPMACYKRLPNMATGVSFNGWCRVDIGRLKSAGTTAGQMIWETLCCTNSLLPVSTWN